MLITRLRSEEEVRGLISKLNGRKEPVALDIETTGLCPRKDKLLTIVLSGTSPESAVLFDAEFARLLPLLSVGLILHNFKFDYGFLFHKGIDLLKHDYRDTMLMHHLLDENAPHSLDDIIKSRYQDNYKEVFWATYQDFQAAPESAQDEYAGKDAIYTLRIFHEFTKELETAGVPKALVEQVHNFAGHLLNTELNGVCIDLEQVKTAGLRTLIKIDELDTEMRKLVHKPITRIEDDMHAKEVAKRKTEKGKARVVREAFGFNSTMQLQRLLYEELKLPRQFTPHRKVTVDDNALSKLENSHPFVKLLREYRGEQKLFTAFLEGALDKAREGRIYPNFNINGTVTGRISASNPNLQQLPASGGIRGMYIPSQGCSFISADYKQLEVTLAAHYSRDANLLRVVNDNISLHDITAEGLGIDRKAAKTINFAIQYGASWKKVRKILQCSEEEAKEALEKYWTTYPGLKGLIDRCHKCVDEGAAISNPFGRQRHLVIPQGANEREVAGVKRQAFNSLIQGTGADVTNTAFTIASAELIESKQGRGLFVVHDECLIEVKDEHASYWNARIAEIMIQVGVDIGLSVPLAVSTSGAMKRWED